MPESDLALRYGDYIACLNRRDLVGLGQFVAREVRYNDRPLGLAGFRDLIQGNYRDIPDLSFHVEMLVCETPHVAARLRFDCTPVAEFLGLSVMGRRVTFAEHVFYRFVDGKIEAIGSVIDKLAIEAQLQGR